MNAYFDAMRRYAVFSGRSTRSQYWLFLLIATALIVIAAVIDDAMTGGTASALAEDSFGGVLTGLVLLIHLLPYWAVTVRRLHDSGLSGWWWIACIIPIIAIILALRPSSPEGVRYDRPATTTAGIPVAVAVASQPSSPQAQVEQLERLAALRASGAIDEEEYRQMKADLLRKVAH